MKDILATLRKVEKAGGYTSRAGEAADEIERLRRENAARSCECPRCGRMHQRLAASPPEAVASQAMKAVDALRTPDASLSRVPNTIRQGIADVIEAQKRQIDRYGLALMMIREGCDKPDKLAGETLGI